MVATDIFVLVYSQLEQNDLLLFHVEKTVAKTVVFTNVKVVIYKLTRALVVKSVDTKDLKSLPVWEYRFESGRGHH